MNKAMPQKAERVEAVATKYTKALCIARYDFAEPITPD